MNEVVCSKGERHRSTAPHLLYIYSSSDSLMLQAPFYLKRSFSREREKFCLNRSYFLWWVQWDADDKRLRNRSAVIDKPLRRCEDKYTLFLSVWRVEDRRRERYILHFISAFFDHFKSRMRFPLIAAKRGLSERGSVICGQRATRSYRLSGLHYR